MGKTRNKIALIAALTSIWPTFASSQQGGAGAPVGGLQIDIGVNSSVKVDSNFKLTPGGGTGNTEIFDNKLSFGLSSINSAYSLFIGATGVLRYADLPGRTTSGLEDPTLRLNFVADSANSRLTFNALYRDVDRDFLNPFQVEQEEQQFGLLVGDGGQLRNTVAGLKYEIGLNDPLSFVFSLNHNDKQYANVVNPQIFDNRTDGVNATMIMRVSPVTTVRLNAGVKHYTADDVAQTDRTTTDYSVGLSQDINPALLLDAQIGITDVNTDTISGTANKSGTTGSLTLTQTLPNGSVFGTISNTVNQNGTRTNLTFGRDLLLSNGSIKATLGMTRGNTGSKALIGSLVYNRQLANGNISLVVNRSASTNNSNQDILDTRIALGYGHNINTVSSVNFTLDWGRTQSAGSVGVTDVDLTNFNASYTRALTSDWNMTGGLTLRQRTETGKADAESTAVFLTLGRNFSYRP